MIGNKTSQTAQIDGATVVETAAQKFLNYANAETIASKPFEEVAREGVRTVQVTDIGVNKHLLNILKMEERLKSNERQAELSKERS